MKKLNRKGFTLIELLAVVVIMGIILVVTIPSVLNTTKTAKEKQLKNAANTVADWYTKQYQLYSLDKSVVDDSFKFKPNSSASNIDVARKFYYTGSDVNPSNDDRKTTLEAAGVSDVETNFDLANSYIILNGNKVCVLLTAKSGGSFYTTNGVNKKCSSTCKHGQNGSTKDGFKCEETYF